MLRTAPYTAFTDYEVKVFGFHQTRQYLFCFILFDNMFWPNDHHQTTCTKSQNQVQGNANNVIVLQVCLYLNALSDIEYFCKYHATKCHKILCIEDTILLF